MAAVDHESPPVTPDNETTQPRSLPGSPFARRRGMRLFRSSLGRQRKGQKRLTKSPISSSSLRQMAKRKDSTPSPQPAEIKLEVTAPEGRPLASPETTKTPSQLHLLNLNSKQHGMATGNSTASVESGYDSGNSKVDLLDGSPQPVQKEKALKEKHPCLMYQVKSQPSTGEKQSSMELTSAREDGDDSLHWSEAFVKDNDHPRSKLKRRSSLTRKPSDRVRKSSDAATPTFCKIYKDIPRRFSPERPRSMSLFLPDELYSDDEDSVNTPFRRLQVSFNKFRRQSIDEGKEFDLEAEPEKPLVESTPKPPTKGQGAVVKNSIESEASPFPSETTMHLWFHREVKKIEQRMEEKIAEVIRESRERMLNVEEKYEKMKSRVEELQNQVQRTSSDPTLSSSPSGLSLSCNSSILEGSATNADPSSDALSFELKLKCHVTTPPPSRPLCHSQSDSNLLSTVGRKLSSHKKKSHTLPTTCEAYEDLPLKPVHEDVILDLVSLIPKWHFIAHRLRVPDVEIQRICADYPLDTREQCYQMLKKWKGQTHPDKYNYHALGYALSYDPDIYSKFVSVVKRIEGDCSPSQ